MNGVTIPSPVSAGVLREAGIRTIEDLRGPAGRLEALLNPSRLADDPRAAVVLCHPHPLFGGSLHNKVVYHAMKTLTEAGLPVLRFNFRGVGRSEGKHDFGLGEREDTYTAIEWLWSCYGLPIGGAGCPWVAHTAMGAGAGDSHVAALISLGTPIEAGDRAYSYDFLAGCVKPKLFLSGAEDPFGPVARVEAALAPVPAKQVAWVDGADHFFTGKLSGMQQALQHWLDEELSRLQLRAMPGQVI